MEQAKAREGEAGDRPVLAPAELQFHLEEYRTLRAEINGNIRSQFETYLYALVANGGIVAWLLTNRVNLEAFGEWGVRLAAFVPLLVTLLAYCWTLFHGTHIQAIGSYLARLESRVGAAGLGWEAFLTDQPGVRRSHWLKRMHYGRLLWIILASADIGFAAFLVTMTS
ncbi:MAG: hypothetical protein KF723_00340 [Rhizobiaceae bacterium]|nr:hypothetical protein [Rhizobiaceae bacterium]